MSLIVGLTGGAASGKSLVGDLFRDLGVEVVDADQAARNVVAPGTPGLASLVGHFGQAILDTDGSLARRRMRERIFSDPDARQTLETLLHPLIHAELQRRRDAFSGDYGILMIPLLARTDMRNLVERVLVVDTPPGLQIDRLIKRDGITRELAERMLAAQEGRQERLEIADDVLRNDGDPEQLKYAVDQLHAHYRGIARGSADPGLRLNLPAPPVR